MNQLRHFIKKDIYAQNNIAKDNTICTHCGSLVNKQNYCPRCNAYMGDTG